MNFRYLFYSYYYIALVGIEGLISEDNLTLVDEENISNVLDELIDVTKTRGGNWRQVSILCHPLN